MGKLYFSVVPVNDRLVVRIHYRSPQDKLPEIMDDLLTILRTKCISKLHGLSGKYPECSAILEGFRAFLWLHQFEVADGIWYMRDFGHTISVNVIAR